VRSRRPDWAAEVRRRAEEVCDLHQRRSPDSSEAAHVLALISNGSTGYVGSEAVAVIMNRFRNAFCVGLTAYSHHSRLRARLREILEAYTAAGCHGVVTADNLADATCPERDRVLNDWGMVSIVVGLLSSTRHPDAVTETGNVLSLVFPEQPGGLASFRTAMTSVPAYRHQPPRYVARGDAVESAVRGALERLKDDARAPAVSAQFGVAGCSRFELVLLPLTPDFLGSVADNTYAALQTLGPTPGNYDLLFAGTRTTIDPDKPTCHITAVALEAIDSPEEHVSQVMATTMPLLHTNGTSKEVLA
jgi:hypothetical protein